MTAAAAERVLSRFKRAEAEQGLVDALKAIERLRELDHNLDEIETTFNTHFHIEASVVTATVLDPTVKTQLDVLRKASEGLKAAEAVGKSTDEIIKHYPEDKNAIRAKKDAETMVERFKKHAEAARKIIRTISAKTMPPALKKLGNAAAKVIEDRLVDPTKFRQIPWMGETWEKNALYSIVFRVEDDFKKYDFYTDRPGAIEITVSVDSGTTKGPVLGNSYGPATELTPRSVADAMFKKLQGWPGLKGESEATAARAAYVDGIKRAMGSAARNLGSMGSGEVTVSKDLRRIEVDYRSDLPKEGASDVGSNEYDRMVDEEVARAKKTYDSALASYKDKIEKLSLNVGEKGYVYAVVTLK